MTLLSFAIALDGTDITDRITRTEILYQRSAIHNQITVTSADPDLWTLLVDNEPSGGEIETVTLERYDWATLTGWSLYQTNRWRTYISEKPDSMRFNMITGVEEATYAALNAAREWFWDPATEYLYTYSTSDPDTLYTDPGPQDGTYIGEIEYLVEHPGAWSAYGGQANTWVASCARLPDVVFFDTYEGQKKTSIAALTASRHWYYDAANELIYCYSTSSPGTLYTEVDLLTVYEDANVIEILKKEITVTLGTDTLRFYMEHREGTEHSFTFGGRSISAAEEKEIIGEYYTELSAATDAETVAAGMLVNRGLTWNADACTIPAGFGFNGAPARGVDQIAQALGLIVRAEDEGDLVVEPHIPGMYPPYGETVYPSGTADVTLDADDDVVDSAQYVEVVGFNYDAVEVSASYEPPEVVMMVYSLLPVNQDSYYFIVLVSCPHAVYNNTETRPELYYSHGTAEYSTTYLPASKEYTENVVFRNGQGKTTWPITAISSIGWNGASRSAGQVNTVEFTQYRSGLTMVSGHAGVASIRYTCETVYVRCTNTSNQSFENIASATGDYINSVAFGVNFPTTAGVKRYQISSGERPADSVVDELLYSTTAKSMRARHILRQAATQKGLIIETPMTERIRDGMIVALDGTIFGLTGQFWAENVTMVIEQVKQKYLLELHQCHPA